jgi:hypothetical protein
MQNSNMLMYSKNKWEIDRYSYLEVFLYIKCWANMNVKHVPDARMVDIRIVEVPHHWEDKVPAKEIGPEDNRNVICLVHEPTGITYRVEVDPNISEPQVIAKKRAEAKLEFIHQLHGESWLSE